MKFRKQDKEFVKGWIDRRFETSELFPTRCLEGEPPQPGKKHIKAYKQWRKTAFKRSEIREWIERWLDTAETAELEEALARSIDPKGE